jgi:uridine kinase
MSDCHKPFIIGVAGGSGSGKSTVTKQIISTLNSHRDISVLYQDNYYKDRSHLSEEERKSVNFDHPNALDWDLMRVALKKLSNCESSQVPIYDFTNHTRKPESSTINPTRIIIIEGIFALYDDEIVEQMSLKIFVDTASDIRLIRRIKRDIIERNRSLEDICQQYLNFVRPMYKQFVEPTKIKADVILPHGSNIAALEMILSRIKAIINNDVSQLDSEQHEIIKNLVMA